MATLFGIIWQKMHTKIHATPTPDSFKPKIPSSFTAIVPRGDLSFVLRFMQKQCRTSPKNKAQRMSSQKGKVKHLLPLLLEHPQNTHPPQNQQPDEHTQKNCRNRSAYLSTVFWFLLRLPRDGEETLFFL